MDADKSSLEPNPNPAVFMNEPQEESGGRTSPETCSSDRVMDLDEYYQSSREQRRWAETLLGKVLLNLVS